MMTELESVDEAEDTESNGIHEKKAGADGGDAVEEFSEATKRLLTASYCGYYVALGLIVGCAGPTLWALAQKTNSTIDELGTIFTARGLGWMIGSMAAGKLYEIWNGHRIIFATMIACTALMALVPVVPFLWLLLALNFVLAFDMSFIDVGANVLIVAVWKEKATPYLQFLHFSFGVGKTEAIAFLLLVRLIEIKGASVAPFIVGVMVTIFTPYTGALGSYWLLAVLALISAFPALMLKAPSPQKSSETSSTSSARLQKIRFYAIIVTISLYLFLYVGAESSYGGWIFTYAVSVYDFGPADGAYLSSLFWGSLTIGRLIAVPISLKMTAKTMLIIDMAGALLSVLALMFLEFLRVKLLLWAMTVTFGLSIASIFATAFSLPPSLNVSITSRAASIMVVGASIGDMTLPMIVGIGPASLLYSIVGIFALSLIMYGLLLYAIPFWFKMKQEEEATELIDRKVEDQDVEEVEEVKEVADTNGTEEDT